MEKADLHNFGKSVQRFGQRAGFVYLKPRPIYWEWLFFGKDSPLSGFFDQSRIGGITPGRVLFNLVTEIENDFSGRSQEVVATSNGETAPSHLYSLGVLLAYCYIFGIRDLHKNNLIKTDTHLQVVDAEVVLSKLLLPHETLLLPFKDVSSDLCGASKVLDLSSEISQDKISIILTGYLDTFESVINHRVQMLEVFANLAARMKQIPIRHILRDTFQYRDAKVRTPEIPFFESELSQLRRDDIPYYFKFMDAPELIELTNERWSFQTVPIPDIFQKGAAREAQNPEGLLDEDRIRKQLFPAGLLYISKMLLPTEKTLTISGDGFDIEALANKVVVKTSMGNFATDRS